LKRIEKIEVIALMKALREKGYTQEELGVALGRTTQSIWAWGSNTTKRVPAKSDWEVLNHLLKK